MNQTYLIIYDVEALEAKLQSALEDLKRNEESMRRMEALRHLRWRSLPKSEMRMKSLNASCETITAKVSLLEEKAREAEECDAHEEFIRDATI